ncbi:hypothetical protein WDW86_11465 [Bdellovibrionota bacterium FG-2]
MMKQFKFRSITLCFAILSAVCLDPTRGSANELHIVGLDKNNQTTSVSVPETVYREALKQVIGSVHGSALKSLSAKSSGDWMLRTVGVGITVTLAAGLGEIASVSAQKTIRLIYSNSCSPILP